MSIPLHTNNPLKLAPLSKPNETPSSKIDIVMAEALYSVAENPTPSGCVAVSKMAEERNRKVKLPKVCEKYYRGPGFLGHKVGLMIEIQGD